ncbi:hypothetical protein KDD17_12110 [Sulfitobacter albidus]|uniref:Uncharacterized protein n=1 Tax=Sulfitobacter albidus TaxID=2829501 RepID=A0A975PLT2_9RHOB|nr:hypothetical protein [Sulfitobacter albidus]QUJ75696.1 hypothetical protein KDD17_12110 [Sulfitobacter albidus]
MPLFALAIPVIHSSGAWIAYAGSGYLAGTLSSTWIGAFILGNSGFLASVGLVSAGGVAAATGALSAVGATTAAAAGVVLTKVGLGGLASWLGIAPVMTFLGVTPVGWAIGGTVAVGATIATVFTKRNMRRINEEREKGDLPPTTMRKILKEVKDYEEAAMVSILERISVEDDSVFVEENRKFASINGVSYEIKRLKYRILKDGREVIVSRSLFGKCTIIYVVHGGGAEPNLSTA